MSSMMVAPVVVKPLIASKKHAVKECKDGSMKSGSPIRLQIQYGRGREQRTDDPGGGHQKDRLTTVHVAGRGSGHERSR